LTVSWHLLQTILADLKPYWRWRWVFILSTWALSMVGWFVVAVLPERYESMTRIYADTDNLLTPLLHNIAVQTDFQKQLMVMQRTLINRTNMARVAQAIDLDLDAQTDLEKERLYASLSSRVTIRVEALNLFQVGFRDSDPKRAKKGVDTLISIFVETNLGQNRASMENARTFLDTQIQDYEQKMRQTEQRLAAFKSQNYEVLPSGVGASFSGRLEEVRRDQMVAKSRADNALAARDQLRAALASIPQFLEVSANPQVVVNGGGAVGGGTTRQRVAQLRREIAVLQSRFTEQHLDVISAKRALDLAERQLAEETQAKTAGGPDQDFANARISNPVYEQLKLRLVQANGDLAQAQSQVAISTSELARIQSMADVAPRIEAELADLNREYGVFRAKYEEMLNRRESARISQAVETSGDKVQFRVIEPPQVPVRPSFPNRPLLMALVFVVAIAGSCGLVFVVRIFDDTIVSARTLTEEFHLRVLGSVSMVDTPAAAATRRRSTRVFSWVAGSLLATFVMVLLLTQLYQVTDLLAKVEMPIFLERLLSNVG
jgi:polysaccharide chain length determinant protein (PEP-CTERM system associated)